MGEWIRTTACQPMALTMIRILSIHVPPSPVSNLSSLQLDFYTSVYGTLSNQISAAFPLHLRKISVQIVACELESYPEFPDVQILTFVFVFVAAFGGPDHSHNGMGSGVGLSPGCGLAWPPAFCPKLMLSVITLQLCLEQSLWPLLV
jgi:hypothetical protein